MGLTRQQAARQRRYWVPLRQRNRYPSSVQLPLDLDVLTRCVICGRWRSWGQITEECRG